MGITPDKDKRFLGIGQILGSGYCISVLDLAEYKIIKELSVPEVTECYKSVCFSGDSRFLACASKGTILLWNWLQGKLISQKETEGVVNRVCINPKDDRVLSASGMGCFRI